MGKKRYKSTKKRIKAVVEIVKAQYQPGDQSRCYAAIWRRSVWPVYGICYKTFLTYLGVPQSELADDPEPEDTRQLSLF